MPPQSTARLPEEVPALFWVEQFGVFRRRWKLLAFCIGAGMGAALCVASLQPRLYHAKTTVEIEPVAEDVLKPGGPSAADIQPPDIQTQIKIIESAAVAGRAQTRLHAVTRRIASSLSVHAAGQTRIIEIEADAPDPQIASDFVNGVAEEYMARHVEAGEQASGVLGARLRQAIGDLRTRLETADGALQSYARESGIILSADQSSVTEERLRQIQDAWSRAEADRVQKQARSEAVAQSDQRDLAAVLNDAAIKGGQEKLADLRRQRAEMSVTYTPEYAKVRRMDAEIESVGSAVQLQIADAARRIRSEYEEARHRELMLGESYRAERAAVLEEGEKRVHYAVLKSESDSTRTLYDTMLARVKETGIASAMRDTNVRVLDRAVPAGAPFQPRLAQALLMGAMAGMLIGFFFAHNVEEADRTVKKPGQMAGTLDAVDLGSVPRFGFAAQSDDAFRSIVASLVLARNAAEQRCFVITSALPGEGKTTVTAELGEAFARIGKRVLLVDGDVLQPDLASRFGMSAIASVVSETSMPGLHVLGMGLMTGDMLHGTRLTEILAYARKNFDIVLFDSAPVLQSPDARVLARAADAAILVVRIGKATREAAHAARQVFAEDGTPVAGIIWNDWNRRNAREPYGRLKREHEPLLAQGASA